MTMNRQDEWGDDGELGAEFQDLGGQGLDVVARYQGVHLV